jgi:Holliday junction DNA helicase RuvB
MADGVISRTVAEDALDGLGVDREGLDELDRQLLTLLLVRFKGNPAGIETIAATVGEESDTLQDVYEPYLIQQGYLMRTSRGRVATELAARHLCIPYPGADAQPRLL